MSRTAGIVVAHSEVAAAMVRAVERISGVRSVLRAVSNDACTPEELQRRVEEALGEDPAVVFVDMASGSCARAGFLVARRTEDVAVVTGVNLPMLLDFVFHREMPPGELADRVAGKGRAAARSHAPRSSGADGSEVAADDDS